jgi:hypothetical protein
MERPTFAHEGEDINYDDKVSSSPHSESRSLSDKDKDAMGEKAVKTTSAELPYYRDEEGRNDEIHIDTVEEIVKTVITVEDDPTLNPWTFRVFFIGMRIPLLAMMVLITDRTWTCCLRISPL